MTATAEHATPADPLGRIVRNSALNAVGTLLIVPCNFVALFTMARRLGAEAMGLFFTLFAICAVIHWIADAGTTTILTRRVARDPSDLRRCVAEALGVMTIVMAASAALLTLVAWPWLKLTCDATPWTVIAPAATAMLGRHALDFASNIFRGLERFEFENLARVVQTAAFCGFVWFLVQSGGEASMALWAFAASNLLAAALIWGVYATRHGLTWPRLSPSIAGRWFRESAPVGVGDVIRHLLLQLDTLLLAAMRPAAMVGLFSVAARPLQPLQLIPRMITSVTFPMMSREGRVDIDKVSRAFAHTTNLLWVASLPVCVATVACAEPLILATVGPAFAEAAGPLKLLIWATVLVFVNAQLRFVLTALDEERKYWRLIASALACKALGGVTLISALGVYGACLANLLGEAALCFGGLWVLRGLRIEGPSLGQLTRAVPAALFMAAVVAPFAGADTTLWRLAIAVVASGVVYIGVCLATGALPWEAVTRVAEKLLGRTPRPATLGPAETSFNPEARNSN